MFGWWKKKKAAKSKAEAERIAMKATDLANEAMADWEATSLQLRRQTLADGFDERLTQIEVSPDLSFREIAEIESLALLKNWIDQKDDIVHEIALYVDPEAWECLKVMDVAEIYIERLSEQFDEVGRQLTHDLLKATKEEASRRDINE